MISLRLFIVIVMCLLTSFAQASGDNWGEVYWVFDFDGTVIEDRTDQAAIRRQIYVNRVTQLHSAFQDDPEGEITADLVNSDKRITMRLPQRIGLSFAEFFRYKQQLAHGPQAELNTPLIFPLIQDPIDPDRPEHFMPGYYYLDESSWLQYRSNGRDSYLLSEMDKAEERIKKNKKLKILGPAKKLVQAAFSDQSNIGRIVINTVSGNSEWEFHELFDRFKEHGLIKYSRDEDGRGPIIKNLGAPESITHGRNSFDKRKLDIVHRAIQDGITAKGKVTIVIAEDQLNYMRAILDLVINRINVKGTREKVTIITFNAGDEGDLVPLGKEYQHQVLIHKDGKVRPPKAGEKLPWGQHSVKNACEASISHGRRFQ